MENFPAKSTGVLQILTVIMFKLFVALWLKNEAADF